MERCNTCPPSPPPRCTRRVRWSGGASSRTLASAGSSASASAPPTAASSGPPGPSGPSGTLGRWSSLDRRSSQGGRRRSRRHPTKPQRYIFVFVCSMPAANCLAPLLLPKHFCPWTVAIRSHLARSHFSALSLRKHVGSISERGGCSLFIPLFRGLWCCGFVSRGQFTMIAITITALLRIETT